MAMEKVDNICLNGIFKNSVHILFMDTNLLIGYLMCIGIVYIACKVTKGMDKITFLLNMYLITEIDLRRKH